MDHLWSNLISFFSGVALTLIAPWVRWSIEKKRDKIKARRDLISNARQFVGSTSFSGFSFSQETYYIQLKPFFDKKLIDWVENFNSYYDEIDYLYTPEVGEPTLHENLKVEIFNQLDRIEKDWGLI